MNDTKHHLLEFTLMKKDESHYVRLNMEVQGSINEAIEYAKSNKATIEMLASLKPSIFTGAGYMLDDFSLESMCVHKVFINCTISTKKQHTHFAVINELPAIKPLVLHRGITPDIKKNRYLL